MKFFIVFFTVIHCFSLFAGLKKNKVGEALIKAQFEQIKDHFFYSLTEDPDLIEKTKQVNESSSFKTYGPYHLVLKGIAPGTQFNLYQFNLFGVDNPHFITSGYIDEQGEAWIKWHGNDMKLYNAYQAIGNVLPGEPMYSMVMLEDKETYIAACIIPNPLEVYGKEGRHVTMQIYTHHNPQYMVLGEHFQPNERMVLSVYSNSSTKTIHLTASEDGTFIWLLEGDRPWRKLGAESMEIISIDQTDPMTISYDWEFLKAKKWLF